MKNILCFGDSNTHGSNPVHGGRWPYHQRWTGLLQQSLGRDGYYVIEEGLGGRTTVFDDPAGGEGRSGLQLLIPILNTHAPLDLVLIMLGTNDAKRRFGLNAYEIAAAAGKLVDKVQAWSMTQPSVPQILLVSPIRMSVDLDNHIFHNMFDQKSIETSQQFARYYQQVASDKGVHFFDAASVAGPSQEDGLHMDAENHKKLAAGLEKRIREILT